MIHPLRLALYWIIGFFVVAFLLGYFSGLATAQTPEDWKRLIRAQAGEFCSVVKRPPKPLIEALNQSVQADPKTWGPVVEWFNRIAEQYQSAGCGDA